MGSHTARSYAQPSQWETSPESCVRRCAQPHTAPRSGTARPAEVLLVDDDALCRRAVAHMIEHCGHHVTQAAGASEALAVAARQRFDVIVSDLGMPGMDGLELLRRVRERDTALSFVLLSGDSIPDTATAALASGATCYLLKPIDLAVLREAIARASELTRASLEQRMPGTIVGPPPAKCKAPHTIG